MFWQEDQDVRARGRESFDRHEVGKGMGKWSSGMNTNLLYRFPSPLFCKTGCQG